MPMEGKLLLIGLSVALALAGLAGTARAQERPGGKLGWHDEFDRPGLPDPGKRGHERGRDRKKRVDKGGTIVVERPWDGFHVYAVEWGPEKMDFFFDDQKYFTYNKSDNDPATWEFDKPHYLILNLAIGGDWGGQRGIDTG